MGLVISVLKSQALKNQALKKFAKDERGSISLLVMSLFMIVVLTAVTLTDISSIYLAKRVLTQANEAAAQRGARNLDLESYYKSRYNATTLVTNVLGDAEVDPGIPIDCSAGSRDAAQTLWDWASAGPTVTRSNLTDMQIDAIECDGFSISIATSAMAHLPFVIPFIGISKVRIHSQVGTIDERKVTNNFYGFNLP